MLLGELDVEVMPAWAVQALQAGSDSPALLELAGMGPGELTCVPAVVATALQELGAPDLTEQQARWELAYAWAEAMFTGELAPYEAARRIWQDAWDPFGRPEQLSGFAYEASEWEDDPEHRSAYEHRMLHDARDLLRQPMPGHQDGQ
ncbi:hypothetical protein CLV92_110167 [Kineococcus xinjiangensis]|uniref:Uncharacterized protein n=1 Tax=Kineococcus xinjiangensis TaxID=512762 RepID=A0A2S6IH39_9ACTN|nr:hypothetical protein [Kineococcus xinjiangensis]PPK93539.1 hypothetical protein CLV92_110167 [Kineococcus xinjiangensis]